MNCRSLYIAVVLLVTGTTCALCFHRSHLCGDTLPYPSQKQKAGFWKKVKPVLSFDNMQSFVIGDKVKINGLKLGLELKFRNQRAGIGVYGLDKPVALTPVLFPNNVDTLYHFLDFGYLSLFWESILYQDFRWEFSAPLSLGLGEGRIDTISTMFDKEGTRRSKALNMITLSAAAHYKIFYWLGVGTGVGYRQMLTKEKLVRQSFNAPFYVIKVKLFTGGLYKSIWRKEQVLQEKLLYREKRNEKKHKRKNPASTTQNDAGD